MVVCLIELDPNRAAIRVRDELRSWLHLLVCISYLLIDVVVRLYRAFIDHVVPVVQLSPVVSLLSRSCVLAVTDRFLA